MVSREHGWYWVKWPNENKWSVAQYIGRVGERQMWSSGDIIQGDAPREIGPRIPTPDEPWDIMPATSLAKLKAEWQAEALEEVVGMAEKTVLTIHPNVLRQWAYRKRRQAEEIVDD